MAKSKKKQAITELLKAAKDGLKSVAAGAAKSDQKAEKKKGPGCGGC